MGDAIRTQDDEVLLITTYWPEPEKILADIRKKHPRLKIIFHQVPSWGINDYVITEGKLLKLQALILRVYLVLFRSAESHMN